MLNGSVKETHFSVTNIFIPEIYMNKVFTALAITALTLSSTSALAGKNKTSILHCGCKESGDAMVYKKIRVSSKSRGHRNHIATSTDACLTGYDSEGSEIYTDFVRAGDDCTLDGDLAGLTACDGAEEGAVCGMEIIE